MALDPTDIAWAIRIARQVSGDLAIPYVWDDTVWTDAINASTFGDPLRPNFDPYLAAMTFLLSPDNLIRRKLDNVEEEFQGSDGITAHLLNLSDRFRAQYGAAIIPVFSQWGP